MRKWCAAGVSVCALSAGAVAQIVGQPIAGSVIPREGVCIQPDVRAVIEARIALYHRMHPSSGGSARDVPLYPFFPQGGTMYRDLNEGNFVDLNPAPNAVENYLCGTYGNDGHLGCDSGSPSWEQMAIGVPTFAALDGTVIDMVDGQPDHNTSCIGVGNYVAIDHGGGRETWYYHFKTNSILVHIGDVVHEGQQLGLAGSSGCSFAPHLHFESHQDGNVIEPFAGPCRPGASDWAHQIDPPSNARVMDFGVTNQDIGAAPPWPDRPPTTAEIAFSDTTLYYWIEMEQLPTNSVWKERYVRPDGTLEYELGPFPFNNPDVYGFSLYWFQRSVAGMQSIAGTWRIQFEVNGEQLIDAPVTVVPTATVGFNRPPQAVTAAFDPPAPGPNTTVFCRLGYTPGIKDLDWDIVSYHYIWKVNGTVIRDVVSVGAADCVPKNAALANQILECTITPNDGHVDGPSTTVRVAVGCYANCDASSTPPTLNVADFTCFLQRYAAADPFANCDNSTVAPTLNVADFTCFLQKYAAGCP